MPVRLLLSIICSLGGWVIQVYLPRQLFAHAVIDLLHPLELNGSHSKTVVLKATDVVLTGRYWRGGESSMIVRP